MLTRPFWPLKWRWLNLTMVKFQLGNWVGNKCTQQTSMGRCQPVIEGLGYLGYLTEFMFGTDYVHISRMWKSWLLIFLIFIVEKEYWGTWQTRFFLFAYSSSLSLFLITYLLSRVTKTLVVLHTDWKHLGFLIHIKCRTIDSRLYFGRFGSVLTYVYQSRL